MGLKKYLLAAGAVLAGLFALSSTYAITLQIGSGANFDRCTTHSGTINVSYSECIGLAWLYQETNGDNRGENTNRFSMSDLENWAGANGNDGQPFRDAFQANITDGHIHELYLYNNNLSGSIMTGLLYLPYLETVILNGNNITSIDLSQNTGLTRLEIEDTLVSSLNLSPLTGLQTLAIGDDTGLASVDVTGLPNLQGLYVQNLGLTGLDLTHNTGLLYLDVQGNHFTGYYSLSGFSNLLEFYGSGNGFTGLYLVNTTGLNHIDVMNNAIGSLDLTTYTSYTGVLVAHFDNNPLGPNGLPLNTLWFLHAYDASRGWKGLGAGKLIIVPVDNCPDGDTSPTQYDGLCSGMSGGAGNAVATTGTVTPTGTVQSTGSNTDAGNDENTSSNNESTFTDANVCADVETEGAFMFAHAHGITTMVTCMKARMDDFLTRAEAAKMISNFAVNVMGLTPNVDMACSFSDMGDAGSEMQGYATTACQLGLMGLEGDGSAAATFNPHGLIDKAQFATILSRMLWGSKYNMNGTMWYEGHVNALKAQGILKVTTDLMNPLKRGWAMLMMMRLDQ